MSTREQKELLLELAEWHSRQFYNNMIDSWTDKDYAFDDKCNKNIRALKKQYESQYGMLPQWLTINDVWDFIKKTKEELNETN